MASVKRNFIYNSAYQLLVAVAPLVTTPYLSRVIGTAGNGVFTYTQSITNYFVLVAVMGMTNYGVRTIAEHAKDREERSRVFWEAFCMQALIGVVVLVAYACYAVVWGQQYLPLWALWGMWVLGSVLDVTWLLWGMQEFRIPTIRNFCTRLASIVAIFVLVRGPEDVWGYVAAIAGAFLANALLVWPVVRKFVDWVRPTWKGMVSHLVPNLVLFVPVVATSLYLIMDKVMLGSMAGMDQTGLYDYAEKVSKSVLVFQAFVVRKQLPLLTFVRGMLPYVAIGAAMFAAIRALAGALGPSAATLGGLLGEVALGGVVYLVLSYAWCWATKSEELKRVLPRLARW